MRFKMKRNEQIEFVSPAEFIPILEEWFNYSYWSLDFKTSGCLL